MGKNSLAHLLVILSCIFSFFSFQCGHLQKWWLFVFWQWSKWYLLHIYGVPGQRRPSIRKLRSWVIDIIIGMEFWFRNLNRSCVFFPGLVCAVSLWLAVQATSTRTAVTFKTHRFHPLTLRQLLSPTPLRNVAMVRQKWQKTNSVYYFSILQRFVLSD